MHQIAHSVVTRIVFAVVIGAVAAAAFACGGDGGPLEDAREVEVAEVLSLKLPATLTPTGVSGIDSVVGRWTSSDFDLVLDYGSHSNPLGNQGKDEYRITITTIDGYQAHIERFLDPGPDRSRPYVTAIHFAEAPNGNRLTMIARTAAEEGQDVAMAIFRSLRFLEA